MDPKLILSTTPNFKQAFQSELGTYVVSTEIAMRVVLGALREIDQIVELALEEDAFTIYRLTDDGKVAILGPVPLYLHLDPDTYPAKTGNMTWLVDELGATPQLSVYNGAQYLAFWLLEALPGHPDPRMTRVIQRMGARHGGREAATRLLMRYLNDARQKAQLPFGATEKRFADKGIDISRVRCPIEPNPTYRGHPAQRACDTVTKFGPAVAKSVGCHPMGTSNSKPGQVFMKLGEAAPRLLEHTVPGLDHLDLSRYPIACSLIRQAMTLVNGEQPLVVPATSQGAQPDVFHAWTAFVDNDWTQGDMICFADEIFDSVQYVWHAKERLVPGTILHVRHGETFMSATKVLAVTPHGRAISFDVVELPGESLHTVSVKGATEWVTIDDVEVQRCTDTCIVSVSTTSNLQDASKIGDRHSNKGLARRMGLTGRIDLPLHSENAQCIMKGRAKTPSAVVEALLSQAAVLLMDIGESTGELQCDLHITATDAARVLERALRLAQREFPKQRTPTLLDRKLAALDVADASGDTQAINQALLHLGYWPVDVQTPTGTVQQECLVSFHAFLVQPQLPELITAPPVVDVDTSLVREGVGRPQLNLRPHTMASGAPALYQYEGLYILHNAPMVAKHLWGRHRDPGYSWIAGGLELLLTQQQARPNAEMSPELLRAATQAE